MTPEEIRADVERVVEAIRSSRHEWAVEQLFAARKRWRSEALEAAERVVKYAPVFEFGSDEVKETLEAIRALKEE